MLDFLSLPSVTLDALSRLPECAGIYFAVAFDGVARQVLYIGKAKNINARWRNHHRILDISRRSGVSIFWLEVRDISSLETLEREFIGYFAPVLNGRSESPDDSDIIEISVPLPGWVCNAFANLAAAQQRTTRYQIAFELERLARKIRDEGIKDDELGNSEALEQAA